jgi:hypothetical protein
MLGICWKDRGPQVSVVLLHPHGVSTFYKLGDATLLRENLIGKRTLVNFSCFYFLVVVD